MKVLVADDGRGHRYSLRKLLEQQPDVVVSGIAEDAEIAPDRVIARQLRNTLDGCPICDGGYRDHIYTVLVTLVMEKDKVGQLRVEHYFNLLQAKQWRKLLCIQDWNDRADTLVGFAVRCPAGRVGIVTIFSPAKPDLPDTPLHYMILPVEEGRDLLALLPSERWLPLGSISSLARVAPLAPE